MSQSLAQIYIHAVFSTKERRPFLQDDEVLSRTHEYLGGACRKLGCPSLRIGGIEDHVHILFRLGRTTDVSTFIREVKRESSKWIKDTFTKVGPFSWQAGYGAFSVSPSHVDPLIAYIDGQREHHHRESFQDEFRRLLRKYDIEWDERYVWD
jgi:REP element-mobilizing transposase RayT